jgi:hypothetical protein
LAVLVQQLVENLDLLEAFGQIVVASEILAEA